MFDLIDALEELRITDDAGALISDERREQRRHNNAERYKTLLETASIRADNNVRYAGLWRRFLASLIDAIILSIAGCIGGFVSGIIYACLVALSVVDVSSVIVGAGAIGFLWGLMSSWLYFTLSESSHKQATIGKLALCIIVTDSAYRRVGLGQANVRYWVKILSTLALFLGFVMISLTKKKQALHDKIAGTLVIMKPR